MNSRMLFLFPALSLLAVICHGQEAKPVAPAPPPPASEEKQEKPEETKPEEKPAAAEAGIVTVLFQPLGAAAMLRRTR